MVNSRKLEDLDPFARDVCNQHLALCHEAGIELIVTSTWRDAESQAQLYAIGRGGDPRRCVTNAKPWASWHQYKAAWDVVPVVSGKPVWDERDPLWQEVITFGRKAGAEAGAMWPNFRDLPHFQAIPLLGGTPITMAQAEYRFKENGTIYA